MTLSLQVDDRRLVASIARASRKYPKAALDGMSRAMLGFRKEFLKDLATRVPKMTKGRAKGALWFVKSWMSRANNVAGKFAPRGRLAVDLRLLEHGGTVRAKHAKYMALPGPGARTASGGVRKGFHSPKTLKRSVHGWAMPRQGNRILMIERMRSGGLGAHLFTLVPSVTIRPRLGLTAFARRASTRAAFWERIRKTLARELGAAWKGGR